MDISEILSTKFTEFDIGAPLSRVAGAFEIDLLLRVNAEESHHGISGRV